MMRLSNFKTALHKRFLAIMLAFSLPFLANADVGITVVTTQNGNEVTADFLVYNFEDIVSMQFTVQWEPTELVYEHITNYDLNDLSAASFGTTLVNNGILTFSWIDQTTEGVTVVDCGRIFSIKFSSLSTQIPPIVINGTQTVVEIVNSSSEFLTFTQNLGCGGNVQVSGNIFNDTSDNCFKEGTESGLEDWKVKIEQNGIAFYRTTNSNGDFNFYPLPGNYDITLILPQNNLWSACQLTQNITVADQPLTVDFAAQALDDCSQLEVDIAAPFLRRCFNSNYHVHYCNYGTVTAEDAYVEVTLDPFLSAVSSSIPWTTVNGQTYTFPIGDVAVGECSDFTLTVLVSCDAVLGQAHCTEAHIFPDDICEPQNPLWDGSMLDVVGNCDGDSVRFTIQNIGDDMQAPVGFIVIEDDMVNFEGTPIQLDAGQNYTVTVPANGSTWRVELENETTSPFNGPATASIEGCGVNGSGSFSLGFVTQFPQGDEAPFLDTDCQPNVGSYDPNDKTGYPNGFCAAHFIEPGTDIEYRIRFQNTGTAPAINVVVRDTLPLTLDPATVQPGASSHAYDFELLGNGVVQFTFTDIMLPDSNANEAASHGFVDFTVSQASTNANGTLVQNQAAIYFDFNEPVYTNTYTHTVADDFVQSAGSDGNLSVSGYIKTWYGLPVEDVEVTLAPTCPVYTNVDGYYEFVQLDTADYALIASKPNLDKQAGVTVLDAIMLRKLILLTDVNNDYLPYQYLAGELNGNGGITTFDLVVLPKMAIGLDVGNAGQNWEFVDASYVFPSDPDPLSGYYAPGSIQFDTLTESYDSVNFKAIKPGDLIHESMVDSSIIKPHFYFKTNPPSNGQVKVEVKANDFYYIKGFQFGLSWEENVLAFLGLEAGAFTNVNSNSTTVGQLQLLVVVPDNSLETLPDSTTLFTLVFNALAPIGTNTPIMLDQLLLPFQVVVEDCKLAGATMDAATITVGTIDINAADFLVKIAPNPVLVGQPFFIEIKTETARTLTLQLFDVSGKLMQKWGRQIQPGVAYFNLNPSLAKGLYLLKIADEHGESRVVKLVVY